MTTVSSTAGTEMSSQTTLNGFKRLDTDIDRITDPVCWNSHVFRMGIRK